MANPPNLRATEAAASQGEAAAPGPSAEIRTLLEQGLQFHQAGRLTIAEGFYKTVLELMEDEPNALANLGAIRLMKDDAQGGAALLQRALAVRPNLWNAHGNLTFAFNKLGRFEEALASANAAIALNPEYPDVYNNLGNTYRELGRTDEAIAAYRRATTLNPAFASAWYNLGSALISTGAYEEGFPLHEWRWAVLGSQSPEGLLGRPAWDGSRPLAGRSILVFAEQGLGDTIQMLRYVPGLAKLGAKVILQAPPALVSLARSVPGVAEVVPAGAPLPAFHEFIAALSLPLAFRTSLESIPPAPYLAAPAAHCARWARRLGERRRPRVGLVWSGNPRQVDDGRRSLPFALMAGLLDLDLEFVTPQIEFRDADRQRLEADGRVRSYAPEIHSFSDTAALIDNLDLVIAVDTSLAHLTGALGKPLWLLLRCSADHRWHTAGETSAWYPSARLFRQDQDRRWEPVIERILAELSLWSRGRDH